MHTDTLHSSLFTLHYLHWRYLDERENTYKEDLRR